MTAHSVLNVRAALEWGNSELYKYYERNGLGYGTVHRSRDLTGDADWLVALTTRVTRGKPLPISFLPSCRPP